MARERALALVLTAILLVGLLISGMLRRRADLSGGRVDREHDGPVIFGLIKLAALGFYGGLLAYALNPAWLGWSQVSLPWGVRWAGLALVALGVAGAIWALRHLGSNVTPTSAVRPDARLVTTGPYRWVRHPLYSFFTLIVIGVSAATASLLIAGAGMLGWIAIIVRIRREEANLRAVFGDAYDRYSRRTGRLLPRSRSGAKPSP